MTHFDVAIVGGGIAGASLGARIASSVRTVILEREEHCAMHSTGRSAAFWLAHYGGPLIIPLSVASRLLLEQGWPTNERSFLRQRGAIVLATDYMSLRDALSVETSKAPRRKEMQRAQLESAIPGLLPGWNFGLDDPSCADSDVAGLHQACLAAFKRRGGDLMCSAGLVRGKRSRTGWQIAAGSNVISADIIVNAAGAWGDEVARLCDVEPLGLQPYRRTVVQLRMGRSGLRDVPLIIDALGCFYFKGEGDDRLWVSPHDETPMNACDPGPDEVDVARAIDHLQSVVDWPVEALER